MGIRAAVQALLGVNPMYRDISYVDAASRSVLGMSAERLFETQPHLRTVISFKARNIAHCGLQVFERRTDTDRVRLRDDPMALLLAHPNASMTAHELIYGLVADYSLYDVAYWLLSENPAVVAGWEILPIPPAWVTRTGGGTAYAPTWMEVIRPGSGQITTIDCADVIAFHGWNPGHPSSGISPVDALRGVLAEQIHANSYRQQVWERGGRVGTVLTRPVDAPAWSTEARTKFGRDWKAKWTGADGAKAGGTPILEDGMSLTRLGFSAKEDEWVEGVKLSLATVASVYHINPTMVGLLDNANFSNVKEFHRMLYTDTLGPDFAFFEDRINGFVVPRVSKTPSVYVEFNVREKMQGSFEEQAVAMSTAIGRPWMTADEGRAMENMTSLGGDAARLVTPLNVLVGGQASVHDSGTQNLNAAPKGYADQRKILDDSLANIPDLQSGRIKSRAPATYEEKAKEVLASFFRHQQGVVLPAIGAKSGKSRTKAADPAWWDSARWDQELSDDLYALAVSTAAHVSAETLKSLGFDPAVYDEARTLNFLKAVANSRAGMVNATTLDQLVAAMDANPDDYPDGGMPTPSGVFETAASSRMKEMATTLITTFSAFATAEAGKQAFGDKGTKTWVVASANPRPSHAAMDGETVYLSENFSNGMAWPGDPVGGAEEVANCTCGLEMSTP